MNIKIAFTCQICGETQEISEYEARHLFPICDDCKKILGELVKREKEKKERNNDTNLLQRT